MLIELILAIIIIRYLRKTLQETGLSPKSDKLLLIAMIVAIALLVLEFFTKGSKEIANWLTHALELSIVYLIFTNKEFRPAKTVMYAVFPFIILSLLNDVTKAINESFYDEWDTYFSTAKFFAVVWMFAMWHTTSRQRKALDTEKLKTQEKEKAFIITTSLKDELEIQVAERTAALTLQKEELQQAITELKATQAQLIQSEKMASLGELTAGIAHEIQNPLNFVNNFAEVNTELITELKEEINKGNIEEAKIIADDIAANEQKINHHGKRADAIVKGMLLHSRSSSGIKEPTDINALADEYFRLAYHGLRAKDKSFNAMMKTDYDESLSTDAGRIKVVPQDMGRVILNLITNAFYAVKERKDAADTSYQPTVSVSTKKIVMPSGLRGVEIKVKDNGNGVPKHLLDKIFQPFFTTKPSGKGTGLGLSMSYDIITKGHEGSLKVETKEGEGSSFIIQIPTSKNSNENISS